MIVGNGVQNTLVEAGIIPELCKRVIIDIPTDDIVTIYYETYDSKKVLDCVFPHLHSTQKINVDDMQGDTNDKRSKKQSR